MIPPPIKIRPCDAGPSRLPKELEVTCHFFGYYFSAISEKYYETQLWKQEHVLAEFIWRFKDFDELILKLFQSILKKFISSQKFNTAQSRILWWNGKKDTHDIRCIGFVAVPPHDQTKESPVRKLIIEMVKENPNYIDCSDLIFRSRGIAKGTRNENERYSALNHNNDAIPLLDRVDQIIILDDVYTTGTSMKAAAYFISDIIEERMVDIQCCAFSKTVQENEAKNKLLTNLDKESIFFPPHIDNATDNDRSLYSKSLKNIESS